MSNNDQLAVLSRSLCAILLMLLMSSAVQAGTVTFLSTNEVGSRTGTVVGTWGANESVSVSDAGQYKMSLTQTSPSFSLFRATLYNLTGTMHELMISSETGTSVNKKLSLEGGDYYLSLFAITDSVINSGAFEVSMTILETPSSVPLPSSAIFMASALMAGASFLRKKPS